jgi:catechol 2,3-dioxygenase-like lactoylglutathione lyase family enzyme
MDQRISFVTLAVRDLGRTRAFYFADPDGFRWEVATNPGPIGQAVLP